MNRGIGIVEALGLSKGVVCLVGAGGKKSTIFRIAGAFEGRLAITATVHTPPFSKRLPGQKVIAEEGDLMARVAATECATVAYAQPSDKKARLAGVNPELVQRIHEDLEFDLTLVKADGARLRWLKAPAEHEPCVTTTMTLLVPIVSVRAVGKALDHQVAHRPERVAGLVQSELGAAVRWQHLASLLTHAEGGMKYHRRADRVVPVINMVDTPEESRTANLIAERVLQECPWVERVLLTSMKSEPPSITVVST